MSDFDLTSGNSSDFSGDSDIAGKLANAKIENSLKEDKEALEIQNSTLKVQFEQAIELANRSKVLQSELIKEKEEKRQLFEQVEILKTQITLLTSSNNELNSKIDVERNKMSEQIKLRDEYALKERNKVKNLYQTKIEVLQQENEELKTKLGECKNKLAIEKSENQQIKEAISSVYKTEFSSCSEAVSYIQSRVVNEANLLSDNKTQINRIVNEMETIQKKYSCERKKRKQLESIVKAQENELICYENEIKKYKETEDAAEKLKSKISEMEEDKQLITSDYEHQIKLLNEKNEKLINECEQLRKNPIKEIVVKQEQPVLHQEVRQMRDCDSFCVCNKHKELSEANSMLLGQIDEMRKAKAKVSDELDKALLKINDGEGKICELKNENEILGNKCKVLEMQINKNNEMEETISTLRKQITSLKSDIRKANNANDQQEKEIQEQKTKNSAIVAENMVLKRSISDYKEQESKLSKEIVSLEEKLDESHGEIMRLQQVGIRKQEVKIETLSAECFKTICFDDSLNTSIEKIANTQALQSQAKIQTIYRTISSFISTKCNEYENQIFNYKKKVEDLDKEQQKNSIDLSIILTGNPNNTNNETILNSLKLLKQERDKLAIEANKRKSVIDYIVSALHLDETKQVYEQIDDKVCYIKCLESKLEAKEKKVKCLCKAIKNMNQQAEKENENAKNSAQQNEMIICELRKKYDELLNKNKVIKVALNEANGKIRELEADSEEKQRKLVIQYEEKINKLNLQHSKAITSLQNENNELESSNNAFAENIKVLEEKNSNMKKAYESQKVAIANLNESTAKLQESSKNAIANVIEQSENEKQKMSSTYTRDIQLLTDETKTLKEQLMRLQKEKNESAEVFEKQITTIKRLKESSFVLEKELKSKEEELVRASQLIETTKSALQAQFDAKVTAMMNEQKYKSSCEKRKLFSFISERVARNVDAEQLINELAIQLKQ